ncbi:hypothetical protein Nepgr_029037 [Nepenthes gracilis]|uniref:AB hydrolase-1 domain-containing protein n=1 Tax=Nepenthes gracilis TaxID=150966 RepID=A0AAD3Y4M4_NEPGR|nr:hypothetical protein Nepgr_029037 [Nepenthes gracilis]
MAAASVSLLATCRSLSKHSSTSRAVKPLVSGTTRTCKMRVPYELKQGQYRQFHELPSGLRMEVIIQKCSINTDEKLPLVFIHGSFHAAWCWAERWLPFFSQHGFDCYAISLLGQGESDSPAGKVAGSLQTHASNIAHFIQKELLLPPVLVGHSFGGLIVQNYIANIRNEQILGCLLPELAGAVLVCSVPPSGNSGLVWRYLFSKPIAAFKVTRSLAAKAFQTSLPLCRETFFSPQMEDHLVLRYQELMTESSRLPLFDLRLLNASLPVPSIPKSSIEVLVLGAGGDFIVDAEGLKETGRFYGVSPISLEGVAHDIMLDCLWERGANAILSWLNGLPKSRHLKAS